METGDKANRPEASQPVVDRLSVALLGLGGVGTEYLSALQVEERFALEAVAERDTALLRRWTEGLPLRTYEDYRSVIVESDYRRLDGLVIALEPFQSIDFVLLAADRGLSVFHKAPAARNLAEAGALLRRFRDGGGTLVVSRLWRHDPAHEHVQSLIERIGRIHTAWLTLQSTSTALGWRADGRRAGGGVLLTDAYDALDMLIHLMGVPDTVTAQSSFVAMPDAGQRHDTEDAVQLLFRFAEGRSGALIALRGAPTPGYRMTLAGEHGTVELSPNHIGFTPRGSARAKSETRLAGSAVRIAIRAFGETVSQGEGKIESTVADHLRTMAVIEAAYLSARTAAPESPAALLAGT